MSERVTPFDISCVIFAGGKSSRMGSDKSLLPFGEYPTLAQYQYERLKGLFRHVYISAKTMDKFDFCPDVITDTIKDDLYAPTAGFIAMFERLDDDHLFVLSVDTPFVDDDIINRLLSADHDGLDAVIARTPTRSHPMCGIYHRSLLPSFKKMRQEDDHRLGRLLKKSRTHFVMFEDEERLANLNHPHEYEAALKRLDSKWVQKVASSPSSSSSR